MYVFAIVVLFAKINVYALENQIDNDSSEFYDDDFEDEDEDMDDENEDSLNAYDEKFSEANVNSSEICKDTYCYPIPDKDSFAFSYSKDTGPTCSRRAFLRGEFLYFKVMEQGLEYALEQNAPAANSNNFPLQDGELKGSDWDWRPGGRIGLGFYTHEEKWNVEAIWTYVNISDHSSKTTQNTFLPLFFPPYTAVTLQKAKAHWHGNFNTCDLLIGKPYHVSRYFVSNPAFGIKLAFINQRYHVTYYPNDVEGNIYAKNDYWGIGLRGCYEGQFLLGCGWSIYGKAAYSLLIGKFDISQIGDEISPDILAFSTGYNLKHQFYDVQSNTELGFGFCFKLYSSECELTTLKLGYEMHQWFEQNQLRKFNDIEPVANLPYKGNLSFCGFMMELLYEF